jgi:hypothetical protein
LVSEPQEAKNHFEVANSHGERFVAEARAQARRFNASEFDSILACSRLLSVLGFAFYRSHRANGAKLSDSAAWTWLHLLRGVKTVYTAVQQSDAKLDPLMSVNMIPEITRLRGVPTKGMQWHRVDEHFRLVQDTQRERFEALSATLCSGKPGLSNEEMGDLNSAIINLDEVTTHLCIGEVHSVFRAICTWPGSISNGFVNMLLENEPLALVVYAHWLMLVMLARDSWWFDDMASAGICEVVDICLRDDPSLQLLLEWPMQMVNNVRKS